MTAVATIHKVLYQGTRYRSVLCTDMEQVLLQAMTMEGWRTIAHCPRTHKHIWHKWVDGRVVDGDGHK